MTLHLAWPPPGLGIAGKLELQSTATAQARGVGGRGDELGAGQVEVAFAWAFLGQAEAVAELFMDNGTWNTPQGEFTGPEAIKKRMDDFDFEHWHARDEVITTEKVGTFGALTYASGTWTNVVSEDGGKPIDLHGIWSVLLLPDGSGSWQILLNNYKILQYER